ncbi:MAG: thioredoxin family protein [Nitrospirae bacterium]|nr:thioredoxin family protein [Nitrospirota bacterium]
MDARSAWRSSAVRRYGPATVVILVVAAAPFALISFLGESTRSSVAPELVGLRGWISSEPLRLAALRGKVVLVDFWTYSCINCLRTIPYLNGWYDRYRGDGLVIIGVHSPEFSFEQDAARVEAAVRRLQIRYPVAVDSDKQTWRSYANQYWPHKYLIDRGGNIRYTQIGEGGYPEMEQHIRELLAEEGHELDPISADVEAEAVDAKAIATPEIYLGSYFGQFLGNPLGLRGMRATTYDEPKALEPNLFYLVGRWEIGEEEVTAVGVGEHKIMLRYTAKAVNVVAGAGGPALDVEVLRDEQPLLPQEMGADVAADGRGRSMVRVGEERLYRLVDDRTGYGVHTVTLIVRQAGLRTYTFTFG